jgi:hypothetical protein
MYTLRMPGFTADHSLYRGENQYGNAISSEGAMAQSVIPQLRCLQWHCQGSECICIRITTEPGVVGGNVLSI